MRETNPSFGLALRANFLLHTLALVFSLLLFRLVYLQGIEHKRYVALAKKQQFRSFPILPRRGDILSKDGRILARSVQVYSLYAVPRLCGSKKEEVWRFLTTYLPLSEKRQKILQKRFFSHRYRHFLWLYRHLPAELYRRLRHEIREQNIPGLYFQKEWRRYYPAGEFLCHVLGFTNIDSVGLEGVEKSLNHLLSGQKGRKVCPVDALGRPLSAEVVEYTPARDGATVVLTVDSRIQAFVEDQLERLVLRWRPKAVCAVVLEASTGRVLALANRPRYNPNRAGQSSPETRRNRVITDYYEPGSTIKVFTAFRAVHDGVVRWEDTFFCHYGKFKFGPRRITDTHGYGHLTVRQILIKSSNIGMAQIGVKLGADKVRQNILNFGFGRKTGIELPGEVAGKVTSKERWSFYSTTSVAMGYEIGVTALQMAMAYAALANGGSLYRPTLIEKVEREGKVVRTFSPLLVRQIYNSPQLQREILDTLRAVVEEGTAKSARLPDYTIGGKTGTARRSAVGRRGYTRNYLASFVAVAPTTQPRVVVVVMTDSPKGAMYGGTVSAPTAARIARHALQTLGVPPDKKVWEKEKSNEKRKNSS